MASPIRSLWSWKRRGIRGRCIAHGISSFASRWLQSAEFGIVLPRRQHRVSSTAAFASKPRDCTSASPPSPPPAASPRPIKATASPATNSDTTDNHNERRPKRRLPIPLPGTPTERGNGNWEVRPARRRAPHACPSNALHAGPSGSIGTTDRNGSVRSKLRDHAYRCCNQPIRKRLPNFVGTDISFIVLFKWLAQRLISCDCLH
jgi:hypothetical protein